MDEVWAFLEQFGDWHGDRLVKLPGACAAEWLWLDAYPFDDIDRELIFQDSGGGE